jgi:hypothetical protein
MNDKIIDFIKFFLLLFTMVMGFFFIYAFVWFAIGLPITQWTTVLLIALAMLSVYGYYRWIEED